MIAMLLNKADARATYQIVFFNTKPVRFCIVHRLTAKHAVSDYAIIGQVPYTAP